ncbi:hypothetical protein PR048_022898 [Dryococelus australis]|uniref:Uncharacterized protein n=1 Tax=Dryococelus australis TaxID=614101 RepID=A0ABQ9GSL8_9NEOP|nr:hypothetical protein PR048_022898 [Dryococelus australis]
MLFHSARIYCWQPADSSSGVVRHTSHVSTHRDTPNILRLDRWAALSRRAKPSSTEPPKLPTNTIVRHGDWSPSTGSMTRYIAVGVISLGLAVSRTSRCRNPFLQLRSVPILKARQASERRVSRSVGSLVCAVLSGRRPEGAGSDRRYENTVGKTSPTPNPCRYSPVQIITVESTVSQTLVERATETQGSGVLTLTEAFDEYKSHILHERAVPFQGSCSVGTPAVSETYIHSGAPCGTDAMLLIRKCRKREYWQSLALVVGRPRVPVWKRPAFCLLEHAWGCSWSVQTCKDTNAEPSRGARDFGKLRKVEWPNRESKLWFSGVKVQCEAPLFCGRHCWSWVRDSRLHHLRHVRATKAIRVQSPAGSLRIFACGNRAGRCRWSAGLLGDLVSPAFSFRRCSIPAPITFICSQDLDTCGHRHNPRAWLRHSISPGLFSSRCIETPWVVTWWMRWSGGGGSRGPDGHLLYPGRAAARLLMTRRIRTTPTRSRRVPVPDLLSSPGRRMGTILWPHSLCIAYSQFLHTIA